MTSPSSTRPLLPNYALQQPALETRERRRSTPSHGRRLVPPLRQDVLDRLLVAKGLLGPIRFAQPPRPDRISLARQILAAHDAAELALAAIARHLDSLPQSSQTYLM